MNKLDLQLRTIRVYGTLAKRLKRRTFEVAVRSPIDAINFLLVNFPEIKNYIEPRAFQIIIGHKAINEHQLSTFVDPTAEIRIIPAICGAGGNGLTSILIGTALIGASLLFPFAAPILLPLGIGLVLTGVAQLIAPVVPDDPERDDPAKSYNFSGVQQTSREGVAVPVVYGDIITGSVVISAGFDEYEEEIEFGYIQGEGDPNPAGDGELFQQVYSPDYCAEHVYKYTIEACITMSWLTSACGPGSVNSCQEVVIYGRTLPREERSSLEFSDQWSVAGDCQCGTFWSNNQPAGTGIVFKTGPGVCGDGEANALATFGTPSAVCGNPPNYVDALSWSVIKTEIIQGSNFYEVDIAGFPHAGFLSNL